jgi:thiamine biosynthesis lipoprotein
VTSASAVDDASLVRLAVDAMATRFELVYWGPRGAGEEALDEIVRLESRLSAFLAASDVSWINAHAGERAVTVEPRTFALLRRCVELSGLTGGAFDMTVGPLLQVWRFAGDGGALPPPELLADARMRVGYQHLHLDPGASTIRFGRSGMRLDLGAAGKGYAIDAAIAVLESHGVRVALLHGGTSSVHAIGRPPDGAWTVGVKNETRTLRDGACSAVVTGPRSLECDALSTALLVLGPEWLPEMRERFPGYDGILI